MSTAIMDGIYKHVKTGGEYRVKGFVTAPMKLRKDKEINFLTIHFLDAREKQTARRFVHLLDSYWPDDRVCFRFELQLQISGTYRPDERIEWVVYESIENQMLFARPRKEFEDGRFNSTRLPTEIRRAPRRRVEEDASI